MNPTLVTRLPMWRFAGALAVVLLCAVTGVAGATGGEALPDARLLRLYQPLFVLHPDELFQPTKVESFITDSQLERFVGTSRAQLPLDRYWTVVAADPGPGDLPAPTPGVFYRLDQTGCSAGAPLAGAACYAAAWATGSGGDALYGHVARTDDRIVLQYWLFYYDNPLLLPATPVGTFWQSHEGDWEVVNVVLDKDERPLEAAYSQHCSGRRMPWAEVEKSPADSTHPVAYVALGSHANYFAPGQGALGAISIPTSCIPSAVAAVLPSLPFLHVVDRVLGRAAGGAVIGPPGSGAEPATIHSIEGTAWSTFGGFWGESEYFFTPIPLGPLPAGAVPLGVGPASPANQAEWNPDVVLQWPRTE
jgi:hypothetical protein